MSSTLIDLDPDVRDMALDLLKRASDQGIQLVVTSTYRSFADQAKLYAQGRTEPGAIVTYAKPGWSMHNHRRAFDVAIKTSPGDDTPANYFDGPWGTVGQLGESVGLEWGGRWSHADRPHFEERSGRTLAWWAAQPETAGLA